MTLKHVFLFLSSFALFTSSCVHTRDEEGPEFYSFPQSFYVEQSLSIQSTASTKSLNAQLERKNEQFKLVIADPMTSLVLAHLTFAAGEKPKILYIHPMLNNAEPPLPLTEIAQSIGELYLQKGISRSEDKYQFGRKEKGWIYTWSSFANDGSCLFPKAIDLRFKGDSYRITIDLKELECPLKE